MSIVATYANGRLQAPHLKGTYPTGGAFTVWNNVLKEFYLPGVTDVLNNKRVLSRVLRRNGPDISVSGSYIKSLARYGRNHGSMQIAEGAPLPDPKGQSYDDQFFMTKGNYGRILLEARAMSASRNSRGAFIRLMDGEVQGLMQDVLVEENRIYFGNGSGRLSTVSVLSTGSVISTKDPGGIPSQAKGTQYLEAGMRVCFVVTASETKNPGEEVSADFHASDTGERVATITDVDAANGTITLDKSFSGGQALPVGTYIYKAGTVEDAANITGMNTNRGNEMHGLAAAISDTDLPMAEVGAQVIGGSPTKGYGSVPVQGNSWWKSSVVSNGGVPMPWSENLIQTLLDLMDQAADGEVTQMMGTHGIRRQWAAQLSASQRFVNTVEYQRGFKALAYNGIPFLVDKDCQRGRVYAMNDKMIGLAYEADWSWIDEDGSVLSRLDNYHAFQAALYRFANLYTRARNQMGLITDVHDV